MNDYDLLKGWRLVPMHLELAIRKFKWLLAARRCPNAHEQFVPATFGCITVAGDGWTVDHKALDSEGQLSEGASRLTTSFHTALCWYKDLSGAEDFFEAWG